MKIKYTTHEGETRVFEMNKDQENVEVEVTKEIFEGVEAFEKEASVRRRRASRHRHPSDFFSMEFEIPDPDADPTRDIEQQEKLSALEAALDQLPQKTRLLIQRVYFEGVSIAQIAQEEGVDRTAINHRLTKIYRQLKDALLTIR